MSSRRRGRVVAECDVETEEEMEAPLCGRRFKFKFKCGLWLAALHSRSVNATRSWQRLVPPSPISINHLLLLFLSLLHLRHIKPSCSEVKRASRNYNSLLRQAVDQAHERKRAYRGEDMPPAVELENERPGHPDGPLELR